MPNQDIILPTGSELAKLLELHPTEDVAAALEKTLLEPLGIFLEQTGKRFRARLLECSFNACLPEGEDVPLGLCAHGALIVESIHAASIIIDDIEDGSTERRGKATFHREVGIPVALNAGNWLYFWPLEKLHDWRLPPNTELKVYRQCMRAIVQAHCGQAMDVGIPIHSIPQSQVRDTTLAALEFKTGALMGLASSLGATLARGSHEQVEKWRIFGQRFGIALQMFDDIGNLVSRRLGEKQYEDLRLRRPSWIWACAAQLPQASYAKFLEAVEKLPHTEALTRWVEEQGLVESAVEQAHAYLDACLADIQEHLPPASFSWLEETAEKLKVAYA